MSNPRYRIYFILGAVVLLLLSFSTPAAQRIRKAAVSTIASLWHTTSQLPPLENVSSLRFQNRLLQGEITLIKEHVMRELALLEELKGMGANVPKEDLEEIESMTKKRYWQQFNLLHQLKAVPAKIICRSPAHWDQSCWINVGTDTNESLGIVVVAKNSPVVVGDAIVGVVEEVGAKQSRIRLLTDASLPISVRALRRAPDGTEMLLAKGEVYGSGQPLWRGQRHLLSGVGFNYDFEDDEGPARDLRTGKVAGAPKEAQNIALIQEGDLLVTTGMDGVFPPNFPVAEVVRVHPLGEGDYSYAIDAVPSAGNFDDLSHVFVLPPL